MRLRSALAAAFGLALMIATPAWAQRYSSLTVFGDSLVDAGNYFIATNGAYPDAASGYFQGRNTNGYDYTDLLSIALYGTPTTPSLAGGSNYAVGGAHAIDTGFADLGAQVGAYASALGAGSADHNGLYILNFGGNDIFNALTNTLGGYPTVDAFLRASAQQYAAGVQALVNLGARNILLTGYPVTSTPFSYTADGYLVADLAALNLGPDVNVMQYSFTSFFERELSNPASLGLPPVYDGTVCKGTAAAPTCDGLFNFDGVHPTAIVQAAIFRDMDAQFGLTATAAAAVPEPALWTQMLLGFLALGGLIRARRRLVLAA